MELLLPRQRGEDQWQQQAFKETAKARRERERERGEISPCLSVCRPGKWGGGTGKLELLLLAAHSAQSPFSQIPACWLVGQWGRDAAGAQQTQTQPGSLIASERNLDCGCITFC